MIALMFGSCATSKRCYEKFGTDTTYVTVHDTIDVEVEVPVKADSLTSSVSNDSLQLLLEGKIDSLVQVSTSGKLETKLWYDKYRQRLAFKTRQQPDTVSSKKRVPVTVVVPCPPVVVDTPQPSKLEKFWKGFQFFSAMLVLGGLCLVAARIIFKRVF